MAPESQALPLPIQPFPSTFSLLSIPSSLSKQLEVSVFKANYLNGFWKTELGCRGIQKLEENVILCLLTMEGRETVCHLCPVAIPCLAKRVFASNCAHTAVLTRDKHRHDIPPGGSQA